MKTVRNVLMLAALGLALSVPVLAQQAGDSAAQKMPPMGPPPELQQLARMVGTWDYTGEVRMGPDSPPMPHTAVSINSFTCGGAAFQSDFSSTIMGMGMKGLQLTTFDRETGKWQTTWIDNFGARISYYEGDFKDGKLVFTGQDKMQGQTIHSRFTFSDITDTSHKYLMENSMDGQSWYTSMQGTYTKQK
ncbi:MAG: DUF1579 family protein [candidate division Zixibacteria bacterium]|nr:DUF1579 family protein [candidate division Zixibacteria bacterium]